MGAACNQQVQSKEGVEVAGEDTKGYNISQMTEIMEMGKGMALMIQIAFQSSVVNTTFFFF